MNKVSDVTGSEWSTHPVFSTLGKIESGRDTREERNPLQHIYEASHITEI